MLIGGYFTDLASGWRTGADTAMRLARYFGTSERFWLGLQVDFDLEEARRKAGARIAAEVPAGLPAA